MLPTIARMRRIDLGVTEPSHAVGTIVLCHGFPGTNLNLPLATALASLGYRTVLFRYAGVDDPTAAWTFDGSAADCATALRVARSEGPGPVIALGYSIGGFHVVRALRTAPALADALVLLGPVLSLTSFRAHLMSRGDDADRFISEGRGLLTGDASARITAYRALEREEQPLAFGAALAIRTVVVAGVADPIVPGDDVRTVVATWRDATALLVNDDHDYAKSAAHIAEAIASLASRV